MLWSWTQARRSTSDRVAYAGFLTAACLAAGFLVPHGPASAQDSDGAEVHQPDGSKQVPERLLPDEEPSGQGIPTLDDQPLGPGTEITTPEETPPPDNDGDTTTGKDLGPQSGQPTGEEAGSDDAKAAAEAAAANYPFDNYAVDQVYDGPVAAPDTANYANWKAFGPDEKDSVLQQAGEGVNFAGAYIVVTVGCGTACQAILVVDARNGHIYEAPRSATHGLTFRKDSRLLVIDPDPETKTPAKLMAFQKGTFSELE